uniref:Uncharacterized protein n=1 Tax=viral metagenome TaxID=1070528 RepID=A0A6M3JGL8_9ZZZZ
MSEPQAALADLIRERPAGRQRFGLSWDEADELLAKIARQREALEGLDVERLARAISAAHYEYPFLEAGDRELAETIAREYAALAQPENER